MKRTAISKPPKSQPESTPPLTRYEAAARSAEKDFWTLRPPADVRRLIARAIRDEGMDKNFWVSECIKAALSRGKRDPKPEVLKPVNA